MREGGAGEGTGKDHRYGTSTRVLLRHDWLEKANRAVQGERDASESGCLVTILFFSPSQPFRGPDIAGVRSRPGRDGLCFLKRIPEGCMHRDLASQAQHSRPASTTTVTSCHHHQACTAEY